METLKKLITEIDIVPSQMHVDNKGFLLISQALEIALASPSSEDVLNCVNLVDKVFAYNKQFQDLPLMFTRKFLKIGLNSYDAKNFEAAEKTFAILSDCRNPEGINNYAYMIRRKETADKSSLMMLKAVCLLRDGVKNNDPFSFVNSALLFALIYGTDEDWKFSDELMKEMPDSDTANIESWWENVGKNGDPEGLLVHYFLLRHDKIKKSVFGNKEQLSKKLSEEIKGFPSWLIVHPRFTSLDDVFKTMLDADFDNNLKKYLDDMPRTHESAKEILYEMTQWDEWLLYKVLLQDFVQFLTKDELSKIVKAYKEKFFTPLSSIIEENKLNDLNKSDLED